MTAVATKAPPVPQTATGGPPSYHHRVAVTGEQYRAGITADALVTEAYVTGTPVTALCGRTFVPSRDPQKFPACPMCTKIEGDARVQ